MEPVPIFRANSAAQARLVQNWLEDNGIPSTLVGADGDSAGLFEIVEADPIVIVAGEDYERAAAALEDYATSVRSEENLSRMSEEEGQFGWPICPTCDELRQATCGKCGYKGSEYDVQVSEAGTLIRCMKCNELTSIVQAETCPFCQHVFGEELQPAEESTQEVVTNTNRVLILMIGIALTIAILAATIIFGGSK
jgi:Putative prokaryotic signal transducing protein